MNFANEKKKKKKKNYYILFTKQVLSDSSYFLSNTASKL